MTDITQVGIFCSQKPLDRKELPLLRMLSKYYTPKVLRTTLLPIIKGSGQGKLSLRALDWLVTNYAKKHRIVFKVRTSATSEKIINIYSDYKAWLRKYRRVHFDPFRRRKRLTFVLDDTQHTTTVGQLNFFYWASCFGVIQYAQSHLATIEKDHSATIKQKRSNPTGKRRQLSVAPPKKAFVYSNPVQLSFNPPPPPSIFADANKNGVVEGSDTTHC